MAVVQTAVSNAEIIDRFLDTAWQEAGLRENTLSAYRNDLQRCPPGIHGLSRMAEAGGMARGDTAHQLVGVCVFCRWIYRKSDREKVEKAGTIILTVLPFYYLNYYLWRFSYSFRSSILRFNEGEFYFLEIRGGK